MKLVAVDKNRRPKWRKSQDYREAVLSVVITPEEIIECIGDSVNLSPFTIDSIECRREPSDTLTVTFSIYGEYYEHPEDV